MQRKWSGEQIIGLLKQNEAGVPAAQLCREHGVSESSCYKWKSKYGGLEVSEAPPKDSMVGVKGQVLCFQDC